MFGIKVAICYTVANKNKPIYFMSEEIKTNHNITTITLSGEKLPKETNNLDLVSRIGSELDKKNKDFRK